MAVRIAKGAPYGRRMPQDSGSSIGSTTSWERRLICAARSGEPVAQTRLLALYEPMVRRIARAMFLPGGDRQDLAQAARLGVIDAARTWDPTRGAPFRSFARLCATREARMLLSARTRKHQILTSACSLEFTLTNIDPAETPTEALRPAVARAAGRRDEDPVAVTPAREQLRALIDRLDSLSALEAAPSPWRPATTRTARSPPASASASAPSTTRSSAHATSSAIQPLARSTTTPAGD